MNLLELVWSDGKTFNEKLEFLKQKELNLLPQITNRKELTFDIYYKFSQDLDEETPNNQWKEVRLAMDVLRVIRKWDRKYIIELKKKVSGSVFSDFFKESINLSKFFLCQNGINCYYDRAYNLKTLVWWGYKLLKNMLISPELYNAYMRYLERF